MSNIVLMEEETIYEKDYKYSQRDDFLYRRLPAILAIFVCGVGFGFLLYLCTL